MQTAANEVRSPRLRVDEKGCPPPTPPRSHGLASRGLVTSGAQLHERKAIRITLQNGHPQTVEQKNNEQWKHAWKGSLVQTNTCTCTCTVFAVPRPPLIAGNCVVSVWRDRI